MSYLRLKGDKDDRFWSIAIEPPAGGRVGRSIKIDQQIELFGSLALPLTPVVERAKQTCGTNAEISIHVCKSYRTNLNHQQSNTVNNVLFFSDKHFLKHSHSRLHSNPNPLPGTIVIPASRITIHRPRSCPLIPRIWRSPDHLQPSRRLRDSRSRRQPKFLGQIQSTRA